jgi:cell division protein FtsB
MSDLYQKKILQDYDSLVAENVRKDRQIGDLEYRVKTLEYHVRKLSEQLRVKSEIDSIDIDGRC